MYVCMYVYNSNNNDLYLHFSELYNTLYDIYVSMYTYSKYVHRVYHCIIMTFRMYL